MPICKLPGVALPLRVNNVWGADILSNCIKHRSDPSVSEKVSCNHETLCMLRLS